MSCNPREEYANPRSVAELYGTLRDRIHTAVLTGFVYLVSGRRTDWQQLQLRRQRVPEGQEYNPAYPGSPTTAVPCRSNHRNLSDDISAADMGGDLDWLHDNARRLGIHFPVPGERWHAEPTDAAPTGRIIPFEPPKPTDPNAGRTWKTIRPGDTDGVTGTIYARGGFWNEVGEVQLRLAGWGLDVGKIDGQYGPKTRLAWRNFRDWVIGVQVATGQTPWKKGTSDIGTKSISVLRFWTP